MICTLDGATILHGTNTVNSGRLNWADCFTDGEIDVTCSGVLRQSGSTGGTTAFWGTGFIRNLQAGSVVCSLGWAAWYLSATAPDFGPGLTTGYTAPVTNTFTLNGIVQVNVAPPAGGHFPPNAPIALALTTVGATPGLAAPYFSAAQIADQFSVKSLTVGANDVYTWQAVPAPVTVSTANLDLYKSLRNPDTGALFASAS
jgi:hypothetical protein